MYEKEIRELLLLEAELFPDEVDLFEDGLARTLGLYRGPGIDLKDWRNLRVRWINNASCVADSDEGHVEQ